MKKFLLLLMFCSTFLLADTLNNLSQVKAAADNSAESFGKGNYKKAIDDIRKYWPLPSSEVDALIYQTETQLKMLASRFGETKGTAFVKEDVLGNTLAQYTYIIKLEKHALRLIYVFYKPENDWKVNVVYWDDKNHLLFK